jgi:DNA-binding Lrp family transcriptional regulator
MKERTVTVATTEKQSSTATFGKVGITAAEVEGIVTGEFPGIPDHYTDAEVLDHKVRSAFAIGLRAHDHLMAAVTEAKAEKIHETLNDPETGKRYKSWTAYITGVIGGLGLDMKAMSAKDKAFLIVLLFNAGMSQQAIAKSLAISPGTVNTAVKRGRELGSVDKDRETTASDGRTYKNTEGEAAAGAGEQAARQVLAARRALSAIKTATNSITEGGMDAESAAQVAGYVKEMQAALTALKKVAK